MGDSFFAWIGQKCHVHGVLFFVPREMTPAMPQISSFTHRHMISTRPSIANTTLAMILAFLSTTGLAVETGVFQPPSLEGYKFEKSWNIDADQVQDGIRETTIEKFVLDRRRVVLKWTSNGKTWYWSTLGNYPDKSDNVNNYGIRDAEGKGVFTEKYPGNEQFYLPTWVKPD